MLDFTEAVREVEAEQVLAACRRLQLSREETAYVLAKAHHTNSLLSVVQVLGGTAADYVVMTVEARPPALPFLRRYR
jgi:hypothetical protein